MSDQLKVRDAIPAHNILSIDTADTLIRKFQAWSPKYSRYHSTAETIEGSPARESYKRFPIPANLDSSEEALRRSEYHLTVSSSSSRSIEDIVINEHHTLELFHDRGEGMVTASGILVYNLRMRATRRINGEMNGYSNGLYVDFSDESGKKLNLKLGVNASGQLDLENSYVQGDAGYATSEFVGELSAVMDKCIGYIPEAS
jgi:hypothetical protein